MTTTLAMLSMTATYWWWALGVLVLAVFAIFLYYRRTMPPLQIPSKAPLIALRILAAIALFLALAEALWSAIRIDRTPSEIIVLFDRSVSMAQTDGGDDNRMERASAFLKSEISSRYDDGVRVLTTYFDDQLYDASDAPPDSLGASTAIGDVIEQLRKLPSEHRPPRAAILLSDGASNRGIDPVTASGRLGYPVITVGFGTPGVAQAQVAAVNVPEVVFTGQPFEVSAEIQGGTSAGNVTVRLSSRGRSLAQKQVSLASSGQRLPVTMQGQIDQVGMQDVRVDILNVDGQALPAAGKTTFVNVMKGRLRVLLVGFQLDWEYSILRRYLAAQDRVELIEHIPGRAGVGAMPSASEWQSLDIAILIHPSREDLIREWQPRVEAMSQPSRGTVFILNERFAGAGSGLPPPFNFMIRTPHVTVGEFLSVPVATRQNHPLVRLNPTNTWEDTRAQWASRPPWTHTVKFDSLPPNADVLVRTDQVGTDCELIWSRPFGRGRALVIAASPMWRWTMENAAQGLAPEEYESFWSNTLRWITLTDDADRLAIRSDLDVYHAGEPIQLDGLVFDEAYRFIDQAEVTARVWPQDGGDTVRLVLNPSAGDRYRGQVMALPPGTYRYDGAARLEDATVQLSGGVFRIEPYGLEQRYSSLDEGTMRAIARESGGRYYTESDSPTFLDSLDLTPSERERKVEVTLGQHWWVLTIFIAALSVEWFVRRRKQLL